MAPPCTDDGEELPLHGAISNTLCEKFSYYYEEKRYYHLHSDKPTVSIFNPDIQKGMKMTFDTKELEYFTEWKMMGEKVYHITFAFVEK